MNSQCYYRVSVKGIVSDPEGRILLCREDNGKWELLGGGLEHGEEPTQGLKREIAEETGLTIMKISAQPKYFLTCKRLDADAYVANIIYEIVLKDLDFTPSSECRELRFWSLQELATVPLFPNVEELCKILRAHETQNEVKPKEVKA